jgi:hypothetical protein
LARSAPIRGIKEARDVTEARKRVYEGAAICSEGNPRIEAEAGKLKLRRKLNVRMKLTPTGAG